MKAVLFHSGEPRVVDRPVPDPPEGEVLVRVLEAGICATDLEIARGYMDFHGVPGHEFVGVVENGSPNDLAGARVVGEINVPCGRCPVCRRGLPRHCPHRTVLGIQGRDGAFAEYLTLPRANLHRVPPGIPDDAAVFAEPLAAAFEILEQVKVRSETRCLVLGDGRLGQLCAAVLRDAGASPVVCGKHRSKLRRLEEMGIRTTSDPAAFAREFDLVVEATGSPQGLSTALRCARPRGTIALKSTYTGVAELDLTSLVVDEITVMGSRCGSFRPALELLSRRDVTAGMITSRFPLAEAAEAFRTARDPRSLKVLLVP